MLSGYQICFEHKKGFVLDRNTEPKSQSKTYVVKCQIQSADETTVILINGITHTQSINNRHRYMHRFIRELIAVILHYNMHL